MERKVVITGMGIWSCLGTTLDEVAQSLRQGKSGIVFSPERKEAGFRSALCADVPRPDLKPYISRNLRQFMHAPPCSTRTSTKTTSTRTR